MQKIYLDGGDAIPNQLGHEATPEQYLDEVLSVLSQCATALKPGRSMFINLGDKYSGYYNGAGNPRSISDPDRERPATMPHGPKSAPAIWGVKNKSLMALPQRLAVRCIDELGLILRSELVWDKRGSALPEPRVRDRAWRTHEMWYHFVNNDRYFYNADHLDRESVWQIGTSSNPDHPATFPEEWPMRLLRGFCPPAGVVLDPFCGSGTVINSAHGQGFLGVGVELSWDYCKVAQGSRPLDGRSHLG